MNQRSPLAVVGAVVVLGVAFVSAGVILFGFLAPERMLDTVGVFGFGIAILLMVGCAGIANYYDLRGILSDAFA